LLPQDEAQRVQDDQTAPTKLLIFENSEMGCQLLAHELQKSAYGVRVVGYRSSLPNVDPEVVGDADVALIASALRDGPMSGFKVLRALRGSNEALRCIMLLDRDDPELVLEAFRAGAAGIFERNDSCERLCKCIQRVREGQVWANNRQLNYLIQALGAEQGPSRRATRSTNALTRREKHIISLLLEGRTNRDIALKANLSEHTVKNHLFRLFKKLGVSSRSELIAHFLQNGDSLIA
jgi:DNA-binding NarL/FixJ family response regulator